MVIFQFVLQFDSIFFCMEKSISMFIKDKYCLFVCYRFWKIFGLEFDNDTLVVAKDFNFIVLLVIIPPGISILHTRIALFYRSFLHFYLWHNIVLLFHKYLRFCELILVYTFSFFYFLYDVFLSVGIIWYGFVINSFLLCKASNIVLLI